MLGIALKIENGWEGRSKGLRIERGIDVNPDDDCW